VDKEALKHYTRLYWKYAAALVLVLVLGVAFLLRSPQAPAVVSAPGETPEAAYTFSAGREQPAPTPLPQPARIRVHIAGEVQNPGVFTLEEGAIVDEALALAGGPTPFADLRRVNLAALLIDNQQIIIPAEGEDSPVAAEPVAPLTSEGTPTTPGLVNINTANEQQLQTLPDIGPARAANIIRHREEHGPFPSVDALQNVSGIGPAIMGNVRGRVTVD